MRIAATLSAVKLARILLACAAAAVVVATLAVVGLAAPAAVSPHGSAARAEYCPAGEHEARAADVKRYVKQMVSAQKRFFRTTKSIRARKAFVKKQQAQLKALKRALARCN